MENRETHILMCGSDRKEKGGMNSVVDQLMNHQWGNSIHLSYLATHVSGNFFNKMFFSHFFIYWVYK